jgi:opacity protein-like surface antigen
MNKRAVSLAIALCAGLLSGPPARADDDDADDDDGPPGKWFLRADAGASHVMKTDVPTFLSPTPGLEAEFNLGLNFGVAGGYQALPWLALEVETGALINSIDKLGNQPVDAALSQIPLMANVVIRCNNFKRFVPYIGAGAGGVASIFAVDETFDAGEGTYRLKGADSDVVFAWQGFAGLRYQINDRMSAGIIYRFFASQSPSWRVENDFDGQKLDITFDPLYSNTISAQFHIKF